MPYFITTLVNERKYSFSILILNSLFFQIVTTKREDGKRKVKARDFIYSSDEEEKEDSEFEIDFEELFSSEDDDYNYSEEEEKL